MGLVVAVFALVQSVRGYSADSRRQITLVFLGSNIANGGDWAMEMSFPRGVLQDGLAHPPGSWQLGIVPADQWDPI